MKAPSNDIGSFKRGIKGIEFITGNRCRFWSAPYIPCYIYSAVILSIYFKNTIKLRYYRIHVIYTFKHCEYNFQNDGKKGMYDIGIISNSHFISYHFQIEATELLLDSYILVPISFIT